MTIDFTCVLTWFQTAEAKQRQAMMLEREANDNEKLSFAEAILGFAEAENRAETALIFAEAIIS